MKDKNEVKRLQNELEKYKTAFRQADLDFFDVNLDTGEAFQSEHLALKMGYLPEEVDTFEKRNKTFHPEDLKKSLQAVGAVVSGESERTDLLFRIFGKNKEIFWIKHDGCLYVDPDTGHRHLIGMLKDVTQEKHYLETLKFMASYDSLTEAMNRHSGFSKLKDDMTQDNLLHVVYFDFDDFKAINDLHGHEMGDRVLKGFAKQINAFLNEDSYLIRVGGDEFIMVVKNYSHQELEDLMADIDGADFCFGENVCLSFSHGTIQYSRDQHDSLEKLISNADFEMYLKKRLKKSNQ